MKQAVAKCLSRLSDNEEHAARAARVGAFKAMSKQISTSKLDDINDSSEQFIDKLAQPLLGTITENKRAARLIGRDDDAIKTILDSIRDRPKCEPLCSYSLNSLGKFSPFKRLKFFHSFFF